MFRDIYRFYRNYTAEKFKYRKQISLLKKICTSPQIYTSYELWEILKHLLLSSTQSLESCNMGIWVGGAWVVNTPVREHNKHFRATFKSLRVSNLGLRSPRPTSLCFERDDTWKGKYLKKENKSNVLFFFFYTPMPEFWLVWVPYPPKSRLPSD